MFNLFSHEEAESHYNNVATAPHEAKFSHEVLAGAAAFAAMHKYEKHLKDTGKPVNHSTMKEFLAAAATAEAVHLAETRGMDALSKHKAKQQAQKQVEELALARYGPAPDDA